MTEEIFKVTKEGRQQYSLWYGGIFICSTVSKLKALKLMDALQCNDEFVKKLETLKLWKS